MDAIVSNCTFDGAYRGVQIAGTSERCIVIGCAFEAQTDTGKNTSVYLDTANITNNKISDCTSDVSDTIVSEASIQPPLEHSIFYITGTTGITGVDTNNEVGGYAGFDGKIIVLVFDEALTVTDGGNLKLNSNFTTTADDTLTLIYRNEVWYEVGRSVN